MSLAEAARLRERLWVTGGSLLILSVVVGLVFQTTTGVGWIVRLLFAAALVLFALGWRGVGSITARRPLGTVALIVLGVWPWLNDLFWLAIQPAAEVSVVIGTAPMVGQLAVALIAVSQIVRAHVLLKPWVWAPAVSLGIVVAVQVGMMVFGLNSQDQTALLAAMNLVTLAQAVAVVGLGVVAIMLSARPITGQSVQVFSST